MFNMLYGTTYPTVAHLSSSIVGRRPVNLMIMINNDDGLRRPLADASTRTRRRKPSNAQER